MNVNTLNRTVLAALIGSALSVGLSAPQGAQAREPRQDRAAQTQSQSDTQDDEETARAKRESARKEREAAAAARAAEQAPPRVQQATPPVPREREQPQFEQRDRAQQQRDEQQADLREQQERIREQNAQTRERNGEQERVRDQELQQAREQQREQAQVDRQRERAGQRDQRPGDAERERQQQERTTQRDERREDRQQANEQRQQANEQRQEHRQEQRDVNKDLRPARRLDNRQRDQRIVREKQQAQVYQQQIQTQIAPQAKAYVETLNHQHRSHGSHYQQQYYWRLLEMLTRWNWQSYNYWNDPYYYTADDYRYYRGGSWYSINRYGADILRQAINFGYQEGLWAGRADRMDGWRYDYRSSWVYRDANYGYRGFYVSHGEYNYYFREGFRRGYQDGFYSHYQYGRNYNGSDVILGGVLSTILNLQAYRW